MCSQGCGWPGRADGTLGEVGPHPLARPGSPDAKTPSQICLSRRCLVTYLLSPRAAWSWSSRSAGVCETQGQWQGRSLGLRV